MKICGIVCEYNPFHSGHRYLIDECRRTLGEETAVVCVMSGDFVQRGEAAIFDKHARARAAVAGGADLVFELPLPWCMAPAETFARGGVGLLGAMGCVTHLAFGSECGDLSALTETAELLLRGEVQEEIRARMTDGLSFAAARQRAAEAVAGKALPALSTPNDILALEYLKAAQAQRLTLTPLAVQRRGAGHDERAGGGFASASMLREKLSAGENIGPYLPPEAFDVLHAASMRDLRVIETALLSRLRAIPEAAFAAAPDVSEGLEHRVCRAARTAPGIEDAARDAAGKRYPCARVRRIMLAAALGLRAGDSDGIPPYLRVLAMNARGKALLRAMEQTAARPLLTKPAHVRLLGGEAERIFSLGAGAADLCALAYCDPEARRGDADWRAGPEILS